MALSSSSRPSLRGRVLSRLPATLTAEGGLAVNKVNGIWTFSPDWSVLNQLTVLPDPETKSLWVLEDATGVYSRLSVQALIDNLPDGPAGVDGALIYVQNSAPVTTGPEGSIWIDADSTDLDLYHLVATVWTDTGANLKGIAATVAAGTTTTLAEGASATFVNGGTTAAAVFNVGIPRGAIPAVGFNFSTTTTDSDPGAGNVRFNNATPASVTAIYFDNADRDANTITTWLDTFDDSTNTAKGTLTFTAAATPALKLVFNVTGSIVDGTGYRKVTVSHVAGATFPSNAAHLAVTFSRAGDKGADGAGTGDVVGPAASVDSEIALFSSTTGKVIKRASLTGLVKATAGVASAATAGTDYYNPGGTDVAVVDGGTGASTLTNHGILLGQGTSPVVATAVGGTGKVLTGVAGADPAFQTAGFRLLNTLTASASATLDDTTSITSEYDQYIFVLENIFPATNATKLMMRVTQNAGSSWLATNYIDNNGTTTYLAIGGEQTLGNGTSITGFTGQVWTSGLNRTDNRKMFFALGAAYNSTPAVVLASQAGFYNGDNGAINGVRFMMSSGNISSGIARIYGRRTS